MSEHMKFVLHTLDVVVLDPKPRPEDGAISVFCPCCTQCWLLPSGQCLTGGPHLGYYEEPSLAWAEWDRLLSLGTKGLVSRNSLLTTKSAVYKPRGK